MRICIWHVDLRAPLLVHCPCPCPIDSRYSPAGGSNGALTMQQTDTILIIDNEFTNNQGTPVCLLNALTSVAPAVRVSIPRG